MASTVTERYFVNLILKNRPQVDSLEVAESYHRTLGYTTEADYCKEHAEWINYWAKLLRAQLELENEELVRFSRK